MPSHLLCAINQCKVNLYHYYLFFSVEEYWEPKLDGLETIIVKRQIPVIHILLSQEMVPDNKQLG